MLKKLSLFLIMALIFLVSAQTSSASIYVGRYSTIFDLNQDQAINLSDASLVAGWLTANDNPKCYQFYQGKLANTQNATSTSANYSVSDSWCSSLLGIVSDAVRTQTYNQIADINSDGKVNLSDISLMSNWYNNDYAQACYYQFTKKYEPNEIHWCAGTFQGIVDSIGEVAGGPDIGIDYLQLTPDMPVVNEPVEIKVQARNTGTTDITSQAVLDNVYKVLGGFVVTQTTMPTVSASDPIKPGETFYYIYKGTYPKKRNEFISFVYNPHDTDAELSFWNNSVTKWVSVYEANPINIVEAKAINVTQTTARIYWKSSMGSNGEYRYSKNAGDLANLPWRTDGVSNNPDVTGNMYASQVDLSGLTANTQYYVQVRKYYQGSSGPQYSADKIVNFKTEFNNRDNDDVLPEEPSSVEKVKVCHVVGNGKTNTLEIAKSALQAHLAHGDKEGACAIEIQPTPIKVEAGIANRVKGRILLQVESKGEAYYVKPSDGKKIYIKDGETAYGVMRDTGLGIKNVDLQKIPIGNDDRLNITLPPVANTGASTNPALVNRVKGRILLQVENNGEAWYVNPSDGKRYYMKDGAAAYQIMRYLSLGISNNDLNKIPE